MQKTTFGPTDESDAMNADTLMAQGVGSWYQLTGGISLGDQLYPFFFSNSLVA